MTAPTVRSLNADESRAFVAARLVAVEHVPYLAHALFGVQPVAALGLGTFAVDASWRLYLDPDALHGWGPALSGAVLVHEVGHLVRDHAGRAAALGPGRDHRLWNYATDAAINDDLIAAGIALPDGVVTPAALGLADGGIEESYYAALAHEHGSSDNDPATGENGDGDGCGSGAGDPAAEWELPPGDARAPGLEDAEATVTRHRVAQAVQEAAARAAGTVPSGWSRWAEQTVAPVVPWRRLLSAAIRRAIAYTAGCVDYSYARPSRRRVPGVILPGTRRPVVAAAVVVDTSASMSPEQLSAAVAEVQGVVRAAGVHPSGVAVLACDASAGATTRVRRATTLELTGGGGTDMRVGIAAALALTPRPDVVIVLTDGYTPWPQTPTSARLVIGLIGAPDDLDTPEWATTVRIPDSGS